jgi:hypothetical protein
MLIARAILELFDPEKAKVDHFSAEITELITERPDKGRQPGRLSNAVFDHYNHLMWK